jgi:hypothetical protein
MLYGLVALLARFSPLGFLTRLCTNNCLALLIVLTGFASNFDAEGACWPCFCLHSYNAGPFQLGIRLFLLSIYVYVTW